VQRRLSQAAIKAAAVVDSCLQRPVGIVSGHGFSCSWQA
jgi:hypothetical protein